MNTVPRIDILDNIMILGSYEEYSYDALGNRYMIVSYDGSSYDTRTFAFIGSSIIRELEDGDTVDYEYMLAGGLGGGIGSIVYQEASDDTLTYYTYNHRGDVSALADENENVVGFYGYDAFGNLLTDAIDAGTDNFFNFSTREFSDLSGLGHWYAREYDPFTGRWIQQDPAGIIDGLNRYVYCVNNPVSRVDLMGQDWFDAVANFSAGFADSLTFGITDIIREAAGINYNIGSQNTSYVVGEWTEVGVEIGLTLGSGILKNMAKKAGSELIQSSAKKATRHIVRNGKHLHHINPLVGHYGRNIKALFPVGGLSPRIHSRAWNLKFLKPADHVLAHRKLRSLERIASKIVNPRMTGVRVLRNLLDWPFGDPCGN